MSHRRIRCVNDEDSDAFIVYKGETTMVQYVEQIKKCILPSSSKMLLNHMTAFASFIDDLTTVTTNNNNNNTTMDVENNEKPQRHWLDEASSSEEEDTVDVDPRPSVEDIDTGSLCTIAWEWHNDVIARKEPLTSTYAYSYYITWGSFCRLFHMATTKDKEKAMHYSTQCLATHQYNLSIASQVCIIVSTDPLCGYSIGELWKSARLTIPTLYYAQYSTTMKEFVYMLLYRYSVFITQYYHQDGEDDEADDEVLELMFGDNPLFAQYHEFENGVVDNTEDDATQVLDEDEEAVVEEPFNAYKEVLLPVSKHYSIRSSFIFDGELLFHSQLLRINMSHRLMTMYHDEKSHLILAYTGHPSNYSEILSRCLNAMCDMIIEITSDKALRYEVNESYKMNINEIHMFHGEKELFVRHWPESSNGAGDVIAKLRPNDHLKISQTMGLTTTIVCKEYQASLQKTILTLKGNGEASPLKNLNLYPFYCHEYEREIVLLVRECLMRSFERKAVRCVDEIKKAFIIEEMNSFTMIDQILMDHRLLHARGCSIPVPYYIVKLMQVYYVIDISKGEYMTLYATHFFCEAVLLWLAMMTNTKILTATVIPGPLLPMIKVLQEFTS